MLETGSEINLEVHEDSVTVHDLSDKTFESFCVAMAKVIAGQYEKELLVKAINKRCSDFYRTDKIEIWKIAMSHLYNEKIALDSDYFDRINLVKESLRNFLKDSDLLSVQGFVNFRLSEYKEALEELAEHSAEEYKVDCEYREFVMMLKYFISLQMPKYIDVHIFYGTDVLIFGDGINVTEEYAEEYKSEIGASTENKDDFILNSLILMAPKKIKLIITDVVPEKEFVDTLKSVFENKISIN